jgi:aspartate beta-hydroxylase
MMAASRAASIRMTAPSPFAPAVHALADEAERLARAGQLEAAAAAFARVREAAPQHARALAFFAMRAFAGGQLAEARRLIDAAVAGWPRTALVQAQRGSILLAAGEPEAALAALLAALELDPDFVPARLDAGILLEDLGRASEAVDHFRQALARLPTPRPAALQSRVQRAEAAIAREQEALQATIAAHLAAAEATIAPEARARFDECLDIFLGRKKPMLPKPGMMHFPKLAPLTFFPREMFDWVERVESQQAVVRAELEALLAQDDSGFMPYVQKSDAEAGNAFRLLNHSRDWGACFLYNQGQRVERHCAACPRTAELLDSLPLVRIAGRGPTAFFSRLRPGTHIVPHHGATNTRLIAHLPLIVPEDCALRVGNDTRPVEAGRMMIFDDTIEHEAWNRSGHDRIVLIFDIWNPFLSAAERELVTRMTEALAAFYPGAQHHTDF